MYDNPFIAPLNDLLARLLIADSTGWLACDIVGVIFFKVIVNSPATPLWDGVHLLSPFCVRREKYRYGFNTINYI